MKKYVSIYKESVILLNENKKILNDNEVRSLINKYDLDYNKLYVNINTWDENGHNTKNKDDIVSYDYYIIYDDMFKIKNDVKHIYSSDINVSVKRNTLSNELQDVYDKLLKLKKDLDKNYIYKLSKASRTSKVKNNVVNKFEKNKLQRKIIVNDINNGKIINDVYTIWSNIDNDEDVNSLKDYICTIDFNSLANGFKEVFETFYQSTSMSPNAKMFLNEIQNIYKQLGNKCKSSWQMKFSNIDRI